MENDRYYFMVGIFIAIAIAASIYVLTWFSGGRQGDHFITYAIYFDESITGLDIGSPVRLKGIQVGNVTNFSFESYETDRIEVLVRILDTAPIRKDTIATLKWQGITGISFISLASSGEDPSFMRLEEGQKYMVIQSSPSELEIFFSLVPKLIDQLIKLSQSGKLLLSDDNIETVGRTLKDLNETVIEGRSALRIIADFVKNLDENPSRLINKPRYGGYRTQ